MSSGRRLRARGAALLAMVAIIALAASWFLVRQLHAESGGAAAVRKARNADVLNRAKQALIGYVAARAASAAEDNPGALPCPEAAGYFDNPAQEGQTASGCTLPKVGRFPWRTIGTEKLVDSAGEPLWFVVSPGWAATSSGFKTNINSNSVGQLTVDGVANAAVALIIAPGPAFTVSENAAFGCAAKVQVRPLTATTDKWQNYLECGNATAPPLASTNFVTTGPSGSFNDQIVRVTVADIMPAIEAAVAKRIDSTIAPVLQSVYTPGSWGFSTPDSNRSVMPYPATFADPSTSDYRGSVSEIPPKGLLPFNQTQGCTADPRCIPSLVAWSSATPPDISIISGNATFQTKTCSWQSGGDIAQCTGEYKEIADDSSPGPTIQMIVTLNNVALGFRRVDSTKISIQAIDDAGQGAGLTTITPSVSAKLNTDGSATLTVTGQLPSINVQDWGTYANYTIRVDRAVVGDHSILSSTDATTGWFVRNEWYRLLYYHVAPSSTAPYVGVSRLCGTYGDCLSVANMTATSDASNPSAYLLVLAGRSVNGSARPSSTLSDYLESTNATGAYVKKPVNTATSTATRFNDRVAAFRSN
jgi:hypothetical protein